MLNPEFISAPAGEAAVQPSSRCPYVRVVARPNFQPFDAIVRNASATGLGLVLQRHCEPGTVLAIQLQSRHAGVSGILTGRVVQAERLPDGNCLLACTLSRRLTEDELLALL